MKPDEFDGFGSFEGFLIYIVSNAVQTSPEEQHFFGPRHELYMPSQIRNNTAELVPPKARAKTLLLEFPFTIAKTACFPMKIPIFVRTAAPVACLPFAIRGQQVQVSFGQDSLCSLLLHNLIFGLCRWFGFQEDFFAVLAWAYAPAAVSLPNHGVRSLFTTPAHKHHMGARTNHNVGCERYIREVPPWKAERESDTSARRTRLHPHVYVRVYGETGTHTETKTALLLLLLLHYASEK
jgi:hypothetical protein